MKKKLSRGLCFVSSLGALVTVALGAAPEPTLEKKGKLLLLDENFEAAALPKGWAKNTGVLSVSGGVLRASQLASENHLGAFRKRAAVTGLCDPTRSQIRRCDNVQPWVRSSTG